MQWQHFLVFYQNVKEDSCDSVYKGQMTEGLEISRL